MGRQEEIYFYVCCQMRELPASESGTPKARRFGLEYRTFIMEVTIDQYELYHRLAKIMQAI